MKLALLARLNAARRERRAAVVVTNLSSGESRLIVEGDDYGSDPSASEIAERLATGASGAAPDGGAFFTVHLPAIRLVLIGAVHVTQSLAPMASLAGFDTVVVDPRTAFASPERFPGATLLAEWPQDVLPRLGLDRFTAVATLTHVPDIDDPALSAALKAGCFYVGALGSRKSHAKRLDRLRARGFGDAELAALHAPIGLAIGARSPGEIAVSILAEVVATVHRRAPGQGSG
jgi:xanthine dehydrogenase accessory factor